jgi:2-oxoglutarate dehydrogenase complex dehydrogenase (E1) component-like enzyme
MRELYNNDPEKFRSIVKEKVNEFRKQEQLNSPSTIETVNKLKNAKNNDERKLYQAQIHEQTKKEFYERQEQSRIHLEDLEKKVKALRQIYEMRKNNADKIINDRVESISQDQSLDW